MVSPKHLCCGDTLVYHQAIEIIILCYDCKHDRIVLRHAIVTNTVKIGSMRYWPESHIPQYEHNGLSILNMLKSFNYYKRYIHILNHIMDLTCPKWKKLSLEQQYMFMMLSVLHNTANTMPADADTAKTFGLLPDKGQILAWFCWYQTWLYTEVLPVLLIFNQPMSEDW